MECLRLSSTTPTQRSGVPTLRGGTATTYCRHHIIVNAHVSERVLRYPDGHERRIIYPAMATLDMDDEEDEERRSWDVSGALWTGAERKAPKALGQVSCVGFFANPFCAFVMQHGCLEHRCGPTMM